MIFFQRRRLLIWLLKAYIKKWKRIIIAFFALGILGFFSLYFVFTHFALVSAGQKDTIGVLGIYNSTSLPSEVLDNVSSGLTKISNDGKTQSSVASSWDIDGSGKIYTFHLKDGLQFSDGTKLTSKEINYDFENVDVLKPDKNTIIFKLKESYSPFLITVSRPIFKQSLRPGDPKNKFVGLGNYKVKSLDLNGDFVNSIELQNIKAPRNSIVYQFYPTENSLKMALVIGEISKTHDISDLSFQKSSFKSFPNYEVDKKINYNKLVTLFYNTQDKALSDKRLRQALTYAIPNDFNQGKRNHTPYPPTLWVSKEDSLSFEQNFDHAKLLFKVSVASESSSLKLNIKTLPQYKDTADKIKDSWSKMGISSNVEITDTLPSNFQVFIGEFFVSKDPDQYTLWHSSQANNLTGYKNLRIDKLLEDGRQTIDTEKRGKIYADFQKYLLDDPPAAFLYFPFNYTLTKKRPAS